MMTTTDIDQTIFRLERLYSDLTGKAPPRNDSPYAPIPPEKNAEEYVTEQLDRLLEMLGGATPARVPPAWTPPVSVWQSGEELVVVVDLPGVPRDSVSVTMADHVITVTGARPAPVADGQAVVREHAVGAFRRLIQVPVDVSDEDISAQMKDGVLEIRARRTRKASPLNRTIAVR